MTLTLNIGAPIKGVPDGKGSSDPQVRSAWLAQRRGGITATEVRDWGQGAKRREIIDGKVNDVDTPDLSHLPAIAHGNRREPIIAEWVKRHYGIEPCDNVYASAANPRYLASPDGVSLDPFTGELMTGPGSAISEIKTSKPDLTPGLVGSDGVLIQIEDGSHFDRTNYYTQMQWSMAVMGAEKCLFVYEQHDNKVDPETGTFTPIGVPQAVWILRDQKLIDQLRVNVADKALAEIDAARAALGGNELPPASDIPSEHALLMAEYLDALDAEAIAKKKKEAAYGKLKAIYMADDAPDISIDGGFAKLSVTTSTGTVNMLDEEGMRRRAPQLVAKYEALVKRYTKPVPKPATRRLTIKRNKGNG